MRLAELRATTGFSKAEQDKGKWMLQCGNDNVRTGCFVWMDIRDYITDDSRISPGLG